MIRGLPVRRTLRYGGARGILTASPRSTSGPTVVFLHGGFWAQPYNRISIALLVRDARRRGWVAASLGYRRLPGSNALTRRGGAGGWPNTFDDVRAGLAAVVAETDLVDPDRLVVVGHSAGGHLALWAAGEVENRPALVVALAAVTDLEPDWISGGVHVTALIRDAPAEMRFELTSPRHRLPLGVPVVCVHGLEDQTVRPTMSSEFVAAARAAGDLAEFVPIAGEQHRSALRPSSAMWTAAVERIERALNP